MDFPATELKRLYPDLLWLPAVQSLRPEPARNTFPVKGQRASLAPRDSVSRGSFSAAPYGHFMSAVLVPPLPRCLTHAKSLYLELRTVMLRYQT